MALSALATSGCEGKRAARFRVRVSSQGFVRVVVGPGRKSLISPGTNLRLFSAPRAWGRAHITDPPGTNLRRIQIIFSLAALCVSPAQRYLSRRVTNLSSAVINSSRMESWSMPVAPGPFRNGRQIHRQRLGVLLSPLRCPRCPL